MAKGRPKVYADEKARKRAFYARHREREKARISKYRKPHRSSISASGSSKSAPAPHNQAPPAASGPFEPLWRSLKLTTPDGEIDAATPLQSYLPALEADLEDWKTWQHDQEEWVALTVAVIKIQCNNGSLEDVQKLILRGWEVARAVKHAAALAKKECCNRRGREGVEARALAEAYHLLEIRAENIRRGLVELQVLYRMGGEQLANAYATQTLIWQNM